MYMNVNIYIYIYIYIYSVVAMPKSMERELFAAGDDRLVPSKVYYYTLQY